MPKASTASTAYDHVITSCPIFELDNSILWYIFSFNADMDSKTETTNPALLTLRYTSQVCSKWRALVNGSPSLWAPVLNFNSLSQKGEQWTREVIRRTGTAPLRIRWKGFGDSSTEFLRIEAILRWIVKENWARIQCLDLHFGSEMAWRVLADERDQWSTILQSPAPSLEQFSFSWPAQPGDQSDADFVLFANDAPLLRALSAINIKLNVPALSTSNIRHLTLHSSISSSDLLHSLRTMQQLEELSIFTRRSFKRLGGGNAYASLPQVIVPRLMSIFISESQGADDSLSFLRHIIPAKGCLLSFASSFHGQFSKAISLELCRDVLSAYTVNCTELANATNVCLRLQESLLSLCFLLPSGEMFFFSINNRMVKFPDHAVPTLLPLLIPRHRQISSLELRAPFTQPQLSDPHIVRFILAFVSVNVLITDGKTLRALTIIQSNTKVVTIPALETINLKEVTRQSDVSLARDFLNSRVELGVSVDTITLKIKPIGVGLELLEEVQGLVVETF